MGDMVIVGYRPKPGCDAALLDLVRTHVAELRALGLATDRPTLAMKAQDGTIVEVVAVTGTDVEAGNILFRIAP